MTPLPSILVPLLPPELLSRHRCLVPGDTRFRAAARLAQSLWRDRQGHPSGRLSDPRTGRSRRLGNLLTAAVARTGANLADPALAPLVRRELAFREVRAVIEPRRLWGNLLSSQALAFNLFLPLKHNPALATAVLARLCPDLVGIVTDILFEHSPARGHPSFTADGTAFDVLVRCTTPAGRRAFLAVEVKYSEAPAGTGTAHHARHDQLSQAAGVYRDPDSPLLRGAAVEQFWRQQLLATAMLQHGLYEEGRVVVIAPAPNRECWQALGLYAQQLVSPDDPAQARFDALPLERVLDALAEAGADQVATGLAQRCLDFAPVDAALTASFATAVPDTA